jgi:spermidine synthase
MGARINHLQGPGKPFVVYSSVFLLSASTLSYEVLLIRLFSIIHWHHFAYMIIGLALLGYGVSGTFVSLFQKALLNRFNLFYPLAINLFAISSLACFLLAQQIPFNAEIILWDTNQLWYLVLLFLLLSIPFFFSASAICLAFMQFKNRTGQIYAFDLIGAGAGSLLIIVLLFWLFPQKALLVISVVALAAAGLALLPIQGKGGYFKVLILLFASGFVFSMGYQLELKLSPYKSLSQALQISGSHIIEQRSSPLGLISVVENNSVPFRYAPGLSLNAELEPLPQVALFTDSDNLTVIAKSPKSDQQLSYLDFMTSALPYNLSKIDSALLVGGGGGSDVLQARYHRVKEIDVLELNPQIIELVDKNLGDFSGQLYSQQDIKVHIEDVRDYLKRSERKFQLIQMSLMDASSASASGLHALNESYLYTTQAIQLYLEHLEPGGYLSLTRWISIPPKDTLKLFNTVVSSLRKSGINDVAERIILIRSWQTSTLVIKNGKIDAREIEQLNYFTQQRSFDLAWYHGIEAKQVNRFNRLSSPLFYNAARHILYDTNNQFVNDYKFDLVPANDDRPYFNFYFKWETFKELFQLRDQGAMPLMEWGYLVLIASLIISVVFSVLLILIPLLVFNHQADRKILNIRQREVVYYFFAIGLAFLMIEIAFIQKFILFLHHPTYSVAVTLTAFLVFAGMGSQLTDSLVQKFGKRHLLKFTCLGIFLIGLLYLLILGTVFEFFSSEILWIRVVITIGLIAPLAFLMGIPFPLALSTLADHAQQYIPWAWGINGCASVISASLATIIAINLGFNVVIMSALVIYLSILKFYPRLRL